MAIPAPMSAAQHFPEAIAWRFSPATGIPRQTAAASGELAAVDSASRQGPVRSIGWKQDIPPPMDLSCSLHFRPVVSVTCVKSPNETARWSSMPTEPSASATGLKLAR